MIKNAPVSKVDPFTGALIVHIPLVSIPGNDGLNLNVTWSFRSGQDISPFESNEGIFTGLVETNKVDVTCDFGQDMCNDPNVAIFQDPSGSRHKFYAINPVDGGAHGIGSRPFESMDGWRADLGVSYSGSGPYAGFSGWIYSPDGTSYHVFNSWPYTGQSPVDQIVSSHGGDKITYAYSRSGGAGRDPFHLQSITMGNYKLTISGDTITSSDGKVWQIDPRTINGKMGPQPDPTYIKLPDQSEWHIGWAGTQVNSITYPDGGMSSFTLGSYNHKCSVSSHLLLRIATTYVSAQINSGAGLASSSWKYNYDDGKYQAFCWNNNHEPYDPVPANFTTKVISPGKEVDYVFLPGYVEERGMPIYTTWQSGLLTHKTTYKIQDIIKTPLEESAYTWSKRHITIAFHGYPEIAQPQLETQTIKRAGITYSTAYTYDDDSMPTSISESSPQGSRTEAISNYEKKYTIDTVPHLLFTPQNETWKDSTGKVVNTTTRTFNGIGELLGQTKNGVKTSYTYDAGGNIASITNALNHKTTLQNYVAGMPQLITDAAGNKFKFVINPNGTITSYTDGLGNKTSYEYDSMYRLTKLTPPQGCSVGLRWNYPNMGGHVVYRCAAPNYYGQYFTVNGFGQPTHIETHIGTNENVISKQEIRYDAYGREIFKSYPVAPNTTNDKTLGTYTTRDALGRVTAVESPLPLTKIGDGVSPIPYQG
ncbi:hypothetical protein BGC07_13230 [Piscirickettsia litoralis]|uniref:RHS repeat protein n=2 Tax=Piscirickettsia litoralis TaxID=1891921 RepID=A0ABX3A630_9GAMM|nr:hypothetical protein BGC07_13230 [Piscirickettsia litoralis]